MYFAQLFVAYYAQNWTDDWRHRARQPIFVLFVFVHF